MILDIDAILEKSFKWEFKILIGQKSFKLAEPTHEEAKAIIETFEKLRNKEVEIDAVTALLAEKADGFDAGNLSVEQTLTITVAYLEAWQKFKEANGKLMRESIAAAMEAEYVLEKNAGK